MKDFETLMGPLRMAMHVRFPDQMPRIWAVISGKNVRLLVINRDTKAVIVSATSDSLEKAATCLRRKALPTVKKVST